MKLLSYSGDFKFGSFEGRGTLTYKVNETDADFQIKAFFKCGRIIHDKSCEVLFSNEDLYKGELHSLNITGKGIYY